MSGTWNTTNQTIIHNAGIIPAGIGMMPVPAADPRAMNIDTCYAQLTTPLDPITTGLPPFPNTPVLGTINSFTYQSVSGLGQAQQNYVVIPRSPLIYNDVVLQAGALTVQGNHGNQHVNGLINTNDFVAPPTPSRGGAISWAFVTPIQISTQPTGIPALFLQPIGSGTSMVVSSGGNVGNPTAFSFSYIALFPRTTCPVFNDTYSTGSAKVYVPTSLTCSFSILDFSGQFPLSAGSVTISHHLGSIPSAILFQSGQTFGTQAWYISNVTNSSFTFNYNSESPFGGTYSWMAFL